jgi:hypothetical protein
MHAGRQIDWIGWQLEFSRRATTLAARRWNAPDTLTDGERRLIERSIATFQLGEQSDGRNLYRRAEAMVVRRGPAALLTTTRYFIREEQHHAAQLKSFMAHHGIPLRKREWTDSIFRGLRRLAGFEWTVRVLVTAEVIGLIYYRALRRATGSPWLQQICRDFCADETVHLRYEADLLATLAQAQSRPVRLFNRAAHRLLLEVASGVVYQQHRPVLQQAGYNWRRFRRGCRAALRVTLFGFEFRGTVLAGRSSTIAR